MQVNTNTDKNRHTERLQKALARAGVASRRACETLIADGRVMVNGEVVREPGTRVDMERDRVQVDGEPVRLPVEYTYIMLHKPAGVVSTADDPQGRPTVVDLVDLGSLGNQEEQGGGETRLFPVGRLDVDSEGLILLTNDGDLTNHLTHPRFQVEKEYHALLTPVPSARVLREWRKGVVLEGKPTAPARVDILLQSGGRAWVRIVMREGRKRQIREVAGLLGFRTRRLIRVREGSLKLGHLPVGKWRRLRPDEVEALRSHAPRRAAR